MYKRILAALDGSRAARLALDEGIGIARAFGAQMLAVSVVEHAPQIVDVGTVYAPGPVVESTQSEAAAVALEEAREAFSAQHVDGSVRGVDAYGESVAAALARVCDEWEPDLIVMGTHGRHGLNRALLGSVAESLLREASVPVLLIRHNVDVGADTGEKPAL
ncbi:universal stress protein [Trinickia dinghuensis]|uniref:Universal stress protein n=1 Tax=Trinickia dinghuensis TaxID=2291023 RepID=A0A3D8K3B3_9BURK|nr:universal stress protein [Trinickia dinghuensis]RDU99365.1 universal stress protein [Trinickia dinghuensis]